MMELGNIEHLKPPELSWGMKKRVGLARAIAYQPQHILYDEPTTGLDPIRVDIISGLIISLREYLRITSIVVTHDMKSAYKIADRIMMLYEGKIIFSGTPEEARDTKNEYIRQFVEGSSHWPIIYDRTFEMERI
ncbi:ATP-binding cassette domain-containing protein [Candidatus Endomicrobiellum trichonymphae]|uniref:ATP-binding cassette domain-containing protein n=1 Tax=Endomicrobium trichonymphae TaxID=1408204 RepID=UPI0011EA652A